MSDDPLKDLFNATFDQEHVAFDRNSWDEMESLLDKKRRRKGFWYWGSGLSAVIAFIAVYLLSNGSITEVYQPRGAEFTFQTMDEVYKSDPQPVAQHLPARAQRTVEVVRENRTAVKNTEGSSSNGQQEPPIRLAPLSPMTSKSIQPAMVTGTGQDAATTEKQIISSQPWGHSTTDTAMADARLHDHLTLIPRLSPELRLPGFNPEDRSIDSLPPIKVRPQGYVRFGFGSTFMNGWGQIAGIGIDHQIADKLILSGEVLMARDKTNYYTEQESIEYGFDRNVTSLKVWATEMLSVEVPVFLRYRNNRLTVGLGMNTAMHLSTEVQEEYTAVDGRQEPSTGASSPGDNAARVGFVQWKELRSLHFSIPLDVQYQLSSRYFAGTRFSYGINDAFSATPATDQQHRFEVYLKMNIHR